MPSKSGLQPVLRMIWLIPKSARACAGRSTRNSIQNTQRYVRIPSDLARTLDYPMLASDQSEVSHLQKQAMLYYPNDGIDFRGNLLRVLHKKAEAVKN